MKTESEIYFEKFCERNRFPLSTVPVGSNRTPDYTLTVGGQLVVVEVKEIQPTAEELESDRLLKERGVESQDLAMEVCPKPVNNGR
jgi:hypothetical protein